jgi:serine/threonine protein kinase
LCGCCFDSGTPICPSDGSELTSSVPVERVIEGRYRLDKLLGKGAMGAVYEATDLQLFRKVAIKIMIGSLFGRATALRRFQREAQASARLSHPNIDSLRGGLSGHGGAAWPHLEGRAAQGQSVPSGSRG